MKLNMVKGPAFCIILLETIRLQKTLFVMNLENGAETELPKMIFDSKSTPQSFQYYDWIHTIVKLNLDTSVKHKILQKS